MSSTSSIISNSAKQKSYSISSSKSSYYSRNSDNINKLKYDLNNSKKYFKYEKNFNNNNFMYEQQPPYPPKFHRHLKYNYIPNQMEYYYPYPKMNNKYLGNNFRYNKKYDYRYNNFFYRENEKFRSRNNSIEINKNMNINNQNNIYNFSNEQSNIKLYNKNL